VSEAKEKLLAAVIDDIAAHGVADRSLRELAAALGTSHRMLIYHFGSRQGLLVDVVREIEARQRAAVAELHLDPDTSPLEAMRQVWADLADPSRWPHERLFFEMYARGLQGREDAAPLMGDVIDAWLGPLTELGRRQGRTEAQARADARLGLAVTRGLLLDLLATGDRAGVDEAMEAYIAQYADQLSRL
jgi:AcrR family transcriptional regulator